MLAALQSLQAHKCVVTLELLPCAADLEGVWALQQTRIWTRAVYTFTLGSVQRQDLMPLMGKGLIESTQTCTLGSLQEHTSASSTGLRDSALDRCSASLSTRLLARVRRSLAAVVLDLRPAQPAQALAGMRDTCSPTC